MKDHLAVNFMERQRMAWRFRVSGRTVDVKIRSGIVVDNAEAYLY